MNAPRLFSLLLLLLVSTVLLSCGEPAARGGVRVVLITLDTLRYDSLLGPNGETSMPNLRRRIDDGLFFERFYSATSSTQPSHATKFTARHPWQHGVTRNGMVLADEFDTVTEYLQQAGFETAAVVSSFPVAARFGFAQGFDQYDDDFEKGQIGNSWEEHRQGDERFYSLADSVTDKSLEFLDDFSTGRQFLWAHYFDPHSPYGDGENHPQHANPQQVLEKAVEREDFSAELETAKRLYDSDVAFMDRHLERLLLRLEADSDRFETHILLTADHGESFGERGSMAHGRRVIPSQIHVPCWILSPRAEPGRDASVAGSADVAPTLLALAGVEPSFDSGRDLTAASRKGPSRAFGMRRTYSEPYEDRRLDGETHVIEPEDRLFYMVDREGTLYRGNRETLLGTLNGSEESPAPQEDLAGQLRQLFARFEEELEAIGTNSPISSDPEVERGLRALGYTGG